MGIFGGGSSSSSSSRPSPEQIIPTRNARKECWNSRDSYYSCLTSNNLIVPPGTDMGSGLGSGTKSISNEEKQKEKEKQLKLQQDLQSDPCKSLRIEYENHCARSWIDYFNKRRVLEERQRLMYAQGKAPPGSGPAPGNRM